MGIQIKSRLPLWNSLPNNSEKDLAASGGLLCHHFVCNFLIAYGNGVKVNPRLQP